jgi:hypothetical protein
MSDAHYPHHRRGFRLNGTGCIFAATSTPDFVTRITFDPSHHLTVECKRSRCHGSRLARRGASLNSVLPGHLFVYINCPLLNALNAAPGLLTSFSSTDHADAIMQCRPWSDILTRCSMVGVRNDEWYCEDRKCKGPVECIFLEWVMPLIYYKHHGKTSTVAGII